ncbi:TetR/AcrR family transcriptional regulator [Paenibacillus radicis (ex Gao et al. 2016)]|uniref:TetR family transcriptional regulator n=1 Tax=Paenibacillus radicis (ex Gao et al. 2016) TaxID=1737354 RepID=A0A917HNJ4_9BACL|nr:TetR-like C-terminal domain-containing protein [Paenibacillus radicis (ex Gao et al. 2016)]GGG84065.1 TetR family transcriptional regulator [Paenibacillus radicis (ex Gao et al. 2016)]
MSTTSPRTDPRVLRTRQLIREAFIDLLQDIELEKITVNRIAERATINRVTFYLHYRDIPDMVEKIADDMIQQIEEILNDASNESPVRDKDWPILYKMQKLIEHIADHSKFYKVLLASKRIPVFTDNLMNLMIKLITERAQKRESAAVVSATRVPTDIAIWYGSSAFIGTIVYWLREDMPYTPAFLAKQLSLLFRLQLPDTN